MKFEVRHDCHILKNQIWLRVTVSRILFNSIQKFVSKSPTRSPNERKECVTHHESVPRLGYLSNWSMKLVILVPRGCAPPTIAVQHRKFAIHGLYVKPEKSDWLRIRNEYSATLRMLRKSGQARGCDSGWRPKEARSLGTRMFSLCIDVILRWMWKDIV